MITRKKIRLETHLGRLYRPGVGAWAIFADTVTDTDPLKTVDYLEYEASESLADPTIAAITEKSIRQFGLLYASCIHRIGRVGVGETAILVITAAARRREADQANQFIIRAVKAEAPVWKKLCWTDGTSEWSHPLHPESRSR